MRSGEVGVNREKMVKANKQMNSLGVFSSRLELDPRNQEVVGVVPVSFKIPGFLVLVPELPAILVGSCDWFVVR